MLDLPAAQTLCQAMYLSPEDTWEENDNEDLESESSSVAESPEEKGN